MLKMLRIIAHDRFVHHGGHSGYLPILTHLGAVGEVVVIHLPLPPRGMRTAVEWWHARRATAGAEAELHVYPEQTLFPRRAGTPFAAICHQPPERYVSRRPRDALVRAAVARAALLVALGPNQAQGLRVLNPRVELVPHGVDVEWFSPAIHRGEVGRYVAIHGWLRDASEQADLIERARRGGAIVVELGGAAPRRSDEEYRALLRHASAVLLWISTGVASNAVLEAASCGKPVLGRLSLDLQTYVSESNRELLRRPVDVQLATPAHELSDVGSQNRAHVLANLSWPQVASQLLSVLSTRLAGFMDR